mgnify:CR=1 FL=1
MKIKNKKLRWKVEENPYPINKMKASNFSIVEDDPNKWPVCGLPCSTSDEQSAALIIKQRRYANLIASAPELKESLDWEMDIIGRISEKQLGKRKYAECAVKFGEVKSLLDSLK